MPHSPQLSEISGGGTPFVVAAQIGRHANGGDLQLLLLVSSRCVIQMLLFRKIVW